MRSLGPLLILLFVIIRVISAAVSASKKSAENAAQTNETEEQKRMRDVQERIRRKIAERRSGTAPLAPPSAESAPPVLRPAVVPPLDPFGGPTMRRAMVETERRVQAPARAERDPMDAVILERQKKLAEEMRGLEAARLVTVRNAAQIVAERQTTGADGGLLAARRADWLADLRGPQSLRRAIVLREILGPPVGLR